LRLNKKVGRFLMAEQAKRIIFFVDDEPKVRKAVSQTLSSLANCHVQDFAAAKTCLAELEKAPCHLLITDINMDGMDGLTLLEHVTKLRPQLPVLLVTGYGDVPMAVEAIKIGAFDFIEKPLDEFTLLAIVEKALERSFTSECFDGKPLTKTEIQILTMIVAGKSNKEVAFQLSRSVRTIENHRHRLMRKLNAENAVDLAKRAIQMGLARD
jgi:two-component system response regulator FixJ